MSPRIAIYLQAAGALLLAGCNGIVLACTEIGCEGGLTVRFNGTSSAPFRVEAWSEVRTEPQVYECPAGSTCPIALFSDFAGQGVTMRVTTVAGTHTQSFDDVDYEPVYPNGRRCGAACEQAEVTVQL